MAQLALRVIWIPFLTCLIQGVIMGILVPKNLKTWPDPRHFLTTRTCPKPDIWKPETRLGTSHSSARFLARLAMTSRARAGSARLSSPIWKCNFGSPAREPEKSRLVPTIGVEWATARLVFWLGSPGRAELGLARLSSARQFGNAILARQLVSRKNPGSFQV